MKFEKLSLASVKNVLSRAELRKIMAGSGAPPPPSGGGGGGGGGGGSAGSGNCNSDLDCPWGERCNSFGGIAFLNNYYGGTCGY
jgi:hypothetical protein